MSRVGSSPILIPEGVTVEKTGNNLVVTGPKGSLKMEVNPTITVSQEAGKIIVKRKNDERSIRALHGLTRSLIANMIEGVTKGWNKNLELVGVGFRAQTDGNKLILNVGFSHPVEIAAPDGITFDVKDNTQILVFGIDKQLVGQIAANIKRVKAPDVYKGKGIRYSGEYIRKKMGKTAKTGVVSSK